MDQRFQIGSFSVEDFWTILSCTTERRGPQDFEGKATLSRDRGVWNYASQDLLGSRNETHTGGLDFMQERDHFVDPLRTCGLTVANPHNAAEKGSI